MLDAFLLGPPQFEHDGADVVPPSGKAAALLTFLAVTGRRSRDDLCALLWGPGRLQNLRQELHVLRQLPGAEAWLVADRSHVEVNAKTDVTALRNAVSEGHDPSRWWRGEPGEGLDRISAPAFVEWLEHLREELDQLRIQASVAAARRALGVDDDDGAWGIVAPLLEEAAHDDLVWRVATEIRLQQGRTAEASALLDLAERRFGIANRPSWTPLVERLRGSTRTARLALAREARRVLQVLCISDGPPTATVLAHALGQTDLALADSLQALRDAGWLDGQGRVPPDVRDDVRAGLAPQTAQVLNGRLADALQAVDAAPGKVAGHLEAAGRPCSGAYLEAGRRSGSLEQLDNALRTAHTARERCDALAEAVRLAGRRGEMPRAQTRWRELEDVAVRSQDPEGLRQTAVLGALLEARAGDLDKAHARLDDAVLWLGDDDPAIAAVRGALAFFAGRPEDARPLLAAGLATDDVDLRLMAVNTLGALAGLAGDTDEADRLHGEALRLARRERRLHLVMMLLNNLAATAQRRGHLDAALERYDEAGRLAESLADAQMQTSVAYNVAHAQIERGQLGRARDPVRRLLGSPVRQPRARGLGCRVRADLERACGRFDEAAGWSVRAAAAFDEAGDVAHAQASRFNEAQARYLTYEASSALVRMREALDHLATLEREDLLTPGRAELALCTPDIDEVRAFVTPQPQTLREWAAAQRLAQLDGAGVVLGVEDQLGQPSFVGSYLDALVASAIEATEPERAATLRRGLRARLHAGAAGLLTAQRASLDARIGRWIEDPVRHW